MAVYIRNLHPTFQIDKPLLSRQARCMKDTLNSGTFRNNDATITLVPDVRMRRLARVYAAIPRTTDVLSFRLADKTPASLRARRAPFPHSWETIFSSLPPSKYVPPPPEEEEEEDDDDGDEASEGEAATQMTIPSLDVPPVPTDIGTIIVAPDYCRRMAGRRRVSHYDYILLAVAHGLAHLAGHTHDTPSTHQLMKQAEQHALHALRTDATLYQPPHSPEDTTQCNPPPESYLP